MEAEPTGILLLQQRPCDTKAVVYVPVQLMAHLFSQAFILENKTNLWWESLKQRNHLEKLVGEILMANQIREGLTHHL
jgi:hypothetical protein